ncbi:MAG: hypothetical protein KDD85_03190 [Parvularculaceae bacterium]|nr:hypothetical protein [Parvularculaceae bacterium]
MSDPSVKAPLENRTVQELQALAATAAAAPDNRAKSAPGLSRAARLHLIDQLSRWSGSGLALFAGLAIFNAIVIARALPLRAAVWSLMLFAALYLCRRYRSEFRRGDAIAARPFRWRANYTSSLAVVSAAFGAGAFLLAPTGAPPAAAMQTLALMLAGATIAAALNLAHRPAAAAAGLPAFAAIFASSFISFGFSQFTALVLVAGISGASFVLAASVEAARRAGQRFPRTALVRREADRGRRSAQTAPEKSAVAS